jgi:hypothetical protein
MARLDASVPAAVWLSVATEDGDCGIVLRAPLAGRKREFIVAALVAIWRRPWYSYRAPLTIASKFVRSQSVGELDIRTVLLLAAAR